MESRIMGVRFCILNKLPMAGNAHRDSLIDDTSRDVGGCSRVILLSVCSDHDVPAIDELCDAAKSRHVVALLKLVDNPVERRLWKTLRGPPGVLQYQTLAWVRGRVVLFRRSNTHVPRPCRVMDCQIGNPYVWYVFSPTSTLYRGYRATEPR